MLFAKYVTQPVGGIEYLSLFREALSHLTPTQIDVAVAYATFGGVRAIHDTLLASQGQWWRTARKRWLVGIDWCRSEPVALEQIATWPSSSLRVPYGQAVLRRRGCTPLVPFHPKAVFLRSPDTLAVVSGSGNLSKNGLTRGHEVGSVLVFKAPLAPPEAALRTGMDNLLAWFDDEWRRADPLAGLLPRYKEVFDSDENLTAPAVTDDDAALTSRTSRDAHHARAATPDKLRKLRASSRFWIEAGVLSKNRGPGRPGNQLMMSPMSRVFFGFPAEDVEPNTAIGQIKIRFSREIRPDCSLRFSDNSMDVLGLPIPGDGGPDSYDGKTLRFAKARDGVFDLAIGGQNEKREWRLASERIGGLFRMTSGRAWGVF